MTTDPDLHERLIARAVAVGRATGRLEIALERRAAVQTTCGDNPLPDHVEAFVAESARRVMLEIGGLSSAIGDLLDR